MSSTDKTWLISMLSIAVILIGGLLVVYGRLCSVETEVRNMKESVTKLESRINEWITAMPHGMALRK